MRFLASAIVVAIAATGCGKGSQNEPQTEPSASVDLAKGMRPETVKSFAGSDVIAVGAPLAKITVPVQQEESRLLADFPCPDGNGCFDEKSFYKAAAARFPDIKRVPFHPTKDMKDDPDALAMYRDAFRDGLYFSKQIMLANGESLFDLISKCSRGFGPIDGATLTVDPGKDSKPYWALQYFPVFRQVGTGEDFEMQILLERRGDTMRATSPLFSTNILEYPDFMQRHALTCSRP